MKTITKWLNKLIIALYGIIKFVAGIDLVAIILIVSAGIISRYVFSNALTWTEEVCCLLLVWLCYLSTTLTTITKEHVVADFLSSRLPTIAQRVLRDVIRVIELSFLGVVTYSTAKLMPRLTNVSSALQMPRYVYYLPVMIFSAIMCIVLFTQFLNDYIPGYDLIEERKKALDEQKAQAEAKENEEIFKSAEALLHGK